MTVLSSCPSCGGALTESDVVCDMHLDGPRACGASFPTNWIPDVEYEPIESEQ